MPGHCHCIVPGCSNRKNTCKFGLFPSNPDDGKVVYQKQRLCGSTADRIGCGGSDPACKNLSFHRLPPDTDKRSECRRQWLAKIPRTNVPLSANSYVCAVHFAGGRRSSADEAPTVFVSRAVVKERQTRTALGLVAPVSQEVLEPETEDCESDVQSADMTVEHDYGKVLMDKRVEDLEKEVKRLTCKLDNCTYDLAQTKTLLEKCQLSYGTMRQDPAKLLFYTGLTVAGYDALLNLMMDNMAGMSYKWDVDEDFLGKDQRGRPRTLSMENELLLTVIKLRHNFPESDLGNRFGITQSSVSRIFAAVLKCMYFTFQELDIWPCTELVDRFMPSEFRKKFPRTRVVIDATEFPIEKPANPKVQATTWSNYKNKNTLKLLVGVTPNGSISFLSSLWGGRISDKEITKRSGILDKLEKGDAIMADRGFDIASLLPDGVELNIPPFLGTRDQLEPEEVVATRRIATLRIHVERAIERIKNYTITHFIPSSLMSLAEPIITVCAFLTLFMEPLVPPPVQEQDQLTSSVTPPPAPSCVPTSSSSTDGTAQPSVDDTDRHGSADVQEVMLTQTAVSPSTTVVQEGKTSEEKPPEPDASISHSVSASTTNVENVCFSCGVGDQRVLRVCKGCHRRYHHMCQNDDDETGHFCNRCFASGG